jgi:hypothetical protein
LQHRPSAATVFVERRLRNDKTWDLDEHRQPKTLEAG